TASMRAFVTGGTGFLGGHIVDKLVSAGFEGVARARRDEDRGRLPSAVRLHLGDVTDLAPLERGLEGCGAAFHDAPLVRRGARAPRGFDRVNMGGLGNVLKAAPRAGGRKSLYTSSCMALGPTDGASRGEGHERGQRILHNDYERGKWAADRFARAKNGE